MVASEIELTRLKPLINLQVIAELKVQPVPLNEPGISFDVKICSISEYKILVILESSTIPVQRIFLTLLFLSIATASSIDSFCESF